MTYFEYLIDYTNNPRTLLYALVSTVVTIVSAPIVERILKRFKKKHHNNNRELSPGLPEEKKQEPSWTRRILNLAFWVGVLWVILLFLTGTEAYLKMSTEFSPHPTGEPPEETHSSGLPSEPTPFPSVGEVVEFGTYKQTKGSNGTWNVEPIRWIVLFRDDEKALLLSEQGLTYKPISNVIIKNETLAWSDSQLCSWLTTEFCGASPDNVEGAFTEEERSILLKNSDGSFAVGLLTKKEAETMLTGATARVCKPTEYAGYVCENNPESKQGMAPTPCYTGDYWWLCDPGEDYCTYMTVDKSGAIRESGTRYTYCGIMVRPTVWISVSDYSRLFG